MFTLEIKVPQITVVQELFGKAFPAATASEGGAFILYAESAPSDEDLAPFGAYLASAQQARMVVDEIPTENVPRAEKGAFAPKAVVTKKRGRKSNAEKAAEAAALAAQEAENAAQGEIPDEGGAVPAGWDSVEA